MPESEGEIHVKAGHLHGAPFYAVKAASGFYGLEPPAIDGLVMAFDARDGSPAAFLLDGGYLTDLRTGAAGGVAARHLAPERVDRVAVIGTGVQAGTRWMRSRRCGQGSPRWACGGGTPTMPRMQRATSGRGSRTGAR